MDYAEEAVRLNDNVRRLQEELATVRRDRNELAQQLLAMQKRLQNYQHELGRMRGF